MPYIGRTPAIGNYTKLDSIASGFNGSSTAFALASGGTSITADRATQLVISIGGVIQEPDTAYTVSGSTITFTGPPPSGASFFGIVLGDTLDIGAPSDQTVTAAKIASGGLATAALADASVTAAKVAANGLGANTFAAKSVGTAAIADAAITGAKVAAAGLAANTLAAGAVTIAKVDVSSLSGGNVAFEHVNNTFIKAQRGGITNLGSVSSDFRPDFSSNNFFAVTLGGSVTIANPTNQVAGQSGAITVTQDGTGSRTLSFGSDFDFAGGTAPTLTATASAIDVLSYYVVSANNIVVDSILNVS
jgi:hypothetical protein